MKTSIENIAKILGVAAWADGVYDETEKVAVEEIAEAFELDAAKLNAEVEKVLAETEKLDEAGVNKYLADAAAGIDKEEAEMVFEAVLEIVLADGIVCTDEVENLLAIAEALAIPASRAMLMLCDMVKEEPELEIEF